MIPTTGEVAALLIGMLLGAVLCAVAGFLVIGVNVWREGIKEGTQLSGEGIERLKKRGEL